MFAGIGVLTLTATAVVVSRSNLTAADHATTVNDLSASTTGIRGQSGANATYTPCTPPPSTNVAPDGSGQYGVGFSATVDSFTLNAGFDEDTSVRDHPKPGQIYNPWLFSLSGITGTVCGLVLLPSLQLVVQPSGLDLDTSAAKLSVIIVPFSEPFHLSGFQLEVSLNAPLTASVSGVRPDGAGSTPVGSLDATGSADATGHFSATNPQLSCTLGVSLPVTTATTTVIPTGRGPGPWTMSGQPVSGGLIGAHATVIGNDFTVGPFTVAGNPDCGGKDAFGLLFNALLGGQNSTGGFYNDAGSPFPSGEASLGAPVGEAQASMSITVTSVDLPSRASSGGPRRG